MRSPPRFSPEAGTACRAREGERYISVSKTLSACDDTARIEPKINIGERAVNPTCGPTAKKTRDRTGCRTKLIPEPPLRGPSWVRGVAWSILGGSGPLDSGSNPDGPTPFRSDPPAVRSLRFIVRSRGFLITFRPVRAIIKYDSRLGVS